MDEKRISKTDGKYEIEYKMKRIEGEAIIENGQITELRCYLHSSDHSSYNKIDLPREKESLKYLYRFIQEVLSGIREQKGW